MPLGVYVTTKTRRHFAVDASATLQKLMMPTNCIMNVIGEILGGGGGESNGSSQVDLDEEYSRASSEMGEDGQLSKRERKSSRKYGWYRTVRGRNYSVYNLDTTNPEAFRRVAKKMGESLGGNL